MVKSFRDLEREAIRSIDGTRDRVFCGGGIDKVKPDAIAELKRLRAADPGEGEPGAQVIFLPG